MTLDLRSLDWERAQEALSKYFHEVNPVRIGDSGKQAIIVNADNHAVGIIKVYDGEDFMCLHIRCSLVPSLAGFMASVIAYVGPITVDEMFEYNYTGDMLVGEEAMAFAAANIKDLWFGFKEKKTGNHNDRPKFLN